MSDSETHAPASQADDISNSTRTPTATSNENVDVGAVAKVSTSTPMVDVDLAEINTPTVRTHTITIDGTSSTSTDVGVQATPAAVSADLKTPHKQQRGILHVTSDMRNSSMKNGRNQPDNRHSVTNTKEKTPMCQINELARFNKLAHKYVLVDEIGPAHKKEFHIQLDLGTENYLATGTSIKRAQHAAAEVALGITVLPKPVSKPQRLETPPVAPDKTKPAVTPTVELNALAMKLGEHAKYINVDPLRVQHFHPHYMYPTMPSYNHPMPHHLYHNPYMAPHIRHRIPQPFGVLLRIGKHEFKGHGTTRQHARHNAANKALKVLNNIALQHKIASPSLEQEKNSPVVAASPAVDSPQASTTSDDDTVPGALSPAPSTNDSDANGASKSEISQVHELALQYGKVITFDVIHESGPPHMRNFTTRSVCGDLVSEGEGNSKKQSKKKAAAMMLAKLQTLNGPTVESKQKVKNVANKKKNRSLIKMQKANVEYGSGINPISRLIQIQQANKRKEPIYTLVMEHGLPRRREFIIQVECNDKACQGKGPNKKLAKRNAAEEMLQLMGYSKPSPTPGKSVLKSPDYSSNSPSQQSKHVTFLDSLQTNKLPGVLVRTDISDKSVNQEMPPFKADLAASLAKELLEQGKSVVGETLLPAKEHPKSPLKRPREQLEYLGSCMGFALDFTDFPKGTNTKMCLTLVTLQTNPAQVFHSSAATVEQSHDKAALQALLKLAKSAPDDDSVEETTPPPIHVQKIEGADMIKEEQNVDDKDTTVQKPTLNGDTSVQSTNVKLEAKRTNPTIVANINNSNTADEDEKSKEEIAIC